MINNYEIIKPFLSFENDMEFYFMQILKRRKENPEIKKDSIVINTYYLTENNIDYQINEAIEIAKICNARVYIHPSVRNFRKVAFKTTSIIAEYYENDNFKNVKSAYDSACGQVNSDRKRWVIDIDTKDIFYLQTIKELIACLAPYKNSLFEVETKNGFHLITEPFNLQTFSKLFPEIIVQKNNATVLFCP